MNATIYFLADLYPWWGLPLAFIFAELANRYRRHGQRPKALMFIAISFVFLAAAAAYFAFNGIERLRPAMKEMERSVTGK